MNVIRRPASGIRRAVVASVATSHPGVIYLLRDEFTTAQSAPLTSPRNAEPGPGTLTITDTNNKASTTGGKLSIATGGAGANDPLLVGALVSRTAGRTLFIRGFGYTAGRTVVGWVTGALASVARIEPQQVFVYDGAGSITPPSQSFYSGTNDNFAIVLRSTGAFFLTQNGGTGSWLLEWVGVLDNTASIKAQLANINTTAVWTQEGVAITDLGGAFASDFGIATLHQTSGLTSGTNFTGDADGIHDLVFTGPGSPALNDTIELRFNITDASNYNTAYMIRAASDWTFKMDTVAGGTPTNRISVTGIATLPDRIRVIGFGSLRDCYTLSGTTWTKRGSQVNVSNQNTSTLTNTTFTGAQFTPTALDSFARTSSSYNVLSSI